MIDSETADSENKKGKHNGLYNKWIRRYTSGYKYSYVGLIEEILLHPKTVLAFIALEKKTLPHPQLPSGVLLGYDKEPGLSRFTSVLSKYKCVHQTSHSLMVQFCNLSFVILVETLCMFFSDLTFWFLTILQWNPSKPDPLGEDTLSIYEGMSV